MLQTILQLLYYALFFFAPLIMASVTSELFEFNKMIFIYSISTLVLFVWVLKMIRNREIILKKTPFDILLLLFIGSQIVSTLFSIDRHTSIYGYYGRFNGGLLSIIAYAILYFAFTSNPLSIKKLLKVSVISSFFVILWGIPGKLGYDLSCFVFMGKLNNACWTDQFHPSERMFSTLGQPNWLGAYLAINFFIGIYFLLRAIFVEKDTTVTKILLQWYLFLNFSAILFTRSRSALISVLGGLGMISLFVVFYFKDKRKEFIKEWKPILVFICLMVFSIIAFRTGFQKIDQFLDGSFFTAHQKQVAKTITASPPVQSGYKIEISESFDIRKIVWKGAIDLANKYPFFGSGVETFAYAYYFVRPVAHNMTSEWDYLYNRAHNEYLNYAGTTGYVGLTMYLLMIGSFVFLTLKTLRKIYKNKELVFLHLALLLSYISILITNFFGFSTTTINLFFYLIPAIIMVSYRENIDENKKINAHDRVISSSQWIYIGITSIATIFFLIFFLNYFMADVTYAKADAYSKSGDYQTSATLLTQALKLKYEHVYEDKISYVLANLAVIASYQKQPELSQQISALAESYNKKSLQASPKNVLYWKTRAKNQYLFYQISLDRKKIEEGITALKEAQKLSPTDPKIPYSLAIFNSLLYDEEKDKGTKEAFKTQSLREVENSILLKPDYRDSYFLKGQLLKKYNQKEEAKKELQSF